MAAQARLENQLEVIVGEGLKVEDRGLDATARSGGCGVGRPTPFDPLRGTPPPALVEVAASEMLVGPARVCEVGPSFVMVAVAGREALERAEIAFSQPYQPAIGDLLVVVGKSGSLYAVGVLRGSGRTTLAVEGDLDVVASGQLRLRGDRGVAIEGEEVTVEAGTLQTVARSAVELLGSLVQRVSGMITQQAKDVHTQADESIVSRSKNAAIVTEENVVVNGKQLFLG